MIINTSLLVHALFPYERFHHRLSDRCNMYNEQFNRYDHFYAHNNFYNHEHYLPDYTNNPDRDLIDCGPKDQFKTMDQSQSKNNTTNINNNSTADNITANNNTMTKLATNTQG